MQNSPESIYLPIAAVRPSPHAARNHNQAQRRKLRSLVEKYGQVVPIIVDANHEIVDGHAVHAVLQELGYDEVQAVVVHNRTEAEIRALRLALNRIGEDTQWDTAKLKGEFEALTNLGFDLDLTGFDAVHIDMTLAIDEPAADAVEEVVAADVEPQAGLTVSKVGDVWRLGRHVVGCGDARDGEHLCRLMPDVRAAVVFTDPPYNVRVRGHVSGLGEHEHREFPMASGEMSRAEFVGFLAAFLATLKPYVVDGAILFVAMDWRHAGELLEAATEQGLEFKNVCVWVKNNAGMGSFYRSQHEFVFVFKQGNAPHQNHFELGQHGRNRTNVWRYAGVNSFGKGRDELLGIHPTCKPVAMIADALKDVSRRGEHVLDPFLGSGSTLMAAEETGRICTGNELDPAYVDVAVRRWQKATGKDAVHVLTGETFDAVAEAAAANMTASGMAQGSDNPALIPTAGSASTSGLSAPAPAVAMASGVLTTGALATSALATGAVVLPVALAAPQAQADETNAKTAAADNVQMPTADAAEVSHD